MTPTSLRVIVADDHPIVLEGIRALLAAAPDITISAFARSFGDVIELLGIHPADVLVLDLGGMGGAPLTLVQRLRRDWPQTEIVVFSSSVDLAPELVKLGVRGYVAKENMSGDLVAAIRAAAHQRQFLSAAAHAYITQSQILRQALCFAPKELVVLRLLTQGLGTAGIAEELGIDPRSAQNYITKGAYATGSVLPAVAPGRYKRLCIVNTNLFVFTYSQTVGLALS